MTELENLIKLKLSLDFQQILEYKFTNPTYMIGGAIKDIMLGLEYKDLDFIQLTDDKSEILNFINNYRFNTKKNSFGDDKIILDNITVDFFIVNDLYKILEFDYDGLIYDITNSRIISIGYFNAIKNGYATRINSNTPHPIIDRLDKINLKIKQIKSRTNYELKETFEYNKRVYVENRDGSLGFTAKRNRELSKT